MSFSERANHPDDVDKQKLKPDIKWYVNNQLVNPITRLLEYFPGIDMDKVAETLGMDKKKLNQNLEYKEEANAVEEGTSLLYNPDEVGGTVLNWKCSCGNKNNVITNDAVADQCTSCAKFLSAHSLQNSVTLTVRKYMDSYNKHMFSFSRKEERIDNKGLPLMHHKIEPEQLTAITDYVSRVNTKIHNLEQLFTVSNTQNKRTVDDKLITIFELCRDQASKVRKLSKFEWIQFGNICARVHADKISCRHYAAINRRRLRDTAY